MTTQDQLTYLTSLSIEFNDQSGTSLSPEFQDISVAQLT